MNNIKDFDKNFASPADYADGFIESDAVRYEKEKNKQSGLTKINTKKLVLNKQPLTKYSASKSQNYSDYYWKCDGSERTKMLNLMSEYNYTEDDYNDSEYHMCEETTERDMLKPSKKEYDAICDYIEQTGADRNIQDSNMIDTCRYLKIEVYNKGIPTSDQILLNDKYDKSNQRYAPDEIITVYESIPNGDTHEFWQVSPKTSQDVYHFLDKNQYKIQETLSHEEAAKYQVTRDKMAYRQQLNTGILPKSYAEMMDQLNTNKDSIEYDGHGGLG